MKSIKHKPISLSRNKSFKILFQGFLSLHIRILLKLHMVAIVYMTGKQILSYISGQRKPEGWVQIFFKWNGNETRWHEPVSQNLFSESGLNMLKKKKFSREKMYKHSLSWRRGKKYSSIVSRSSSASFALRLHLFISWERKLLLI